MSGKLPWMKFYPADWSQDTTPLSLSARGAWITIVCAMWRSEERGKLSMPLAGFCRLLGAPESETLAVLEELSVTGTASRVTEADKKVTLTCRRMVREHKSLINHALRQQRYRVTHSSDAEMTGEKSEVRSQKSEIRVREEKEAPPAVQVKNKFSEAISKLKSGHISFKPVPDVAIENALKGWPPERWGEAINSLLHRYAGANIPRPIATLENHLAGKQTAQTTSKVFPRDLFERIKMLETELGHAKNFSRTDDIKRLNAEIASTKKRYFEATK